MTGKDNEGKMTAADLAAKLALDPEFLRRRRRLESELQMRVEAWRMAEKPIVDDLRAAGLDVQSVWDLVNTDVPYPQALPILIEYLETGSFPDRVMEGVGRALAVLPAGKFWDRLASVYRLADSEGQAEGAAVALAACASAEHVPEMIDFLSIAERGETRVYFLRPIRDLGGAHGRAALQACIQDEDLGIEAKTLLGLAT